MGVRAGAGPQARAALTAAAVAVVLVAAALAGRTVAGPPRAPVWLPAPACPAGLAQAAPGTGPSSVLFVPYGPVSGSVCVYPPDGGPVRRDTLDPTAVAELAGLLHPLPPAQPTCSVAGSPAGTAAQGPVAVAVLRYRPRTVPTVGDELRVTLTGTPCMLALNGLRTVSVDPTTADRLVGLAPVLRSVFPTD